MADPLEAAAKRAAEFEAQRKAATEQAASTGGPLGIGDPYKKYVVDPIAGSRAVQALPPWARAVGGAILPQNTPELAVALATAPIGGPLGSFGAKTAGKVAATTLAPLAKRALASMAQGAGVGGVAGYLTGYNPLGSAGLGALGNLGGQLTHEGLRALTQNAIVKRMVKTASQRLATLVEKTFPGLAGKDQQNVLMRLLNGELIQDLEKEIHPFAQHLPQHDPMFDAITAEAWTREAIARGGNPLPMVNGIPTPDLRVIWQYVPEARGMLARFLSQAEQDGVKMWMQGLVKAGTLRKWLTGSDDPAALSTAQLQEIKKRLFNKAGELTMEGLNELNSRFAIQAPELRGALRTKAADLGEAIWQITGRSAETGTPAEKVGFKWKPPFFEGGSPAHLPGWEAVPRTASERVRQGAADWVPPLVTALPPGAGTARPEAPPRAEPRAEIPPGLGWFGPATAEAGPTLPPPPVLERRPPSDEGPTWFSNRPSTEPPSPGAFPKGESAPEELEVTLDINKPP